MKIWAHTLVCNEERYVWFAIKSVIDHVDEVLVWDTGSEDKTVEIIRTLKKRYPEKIEFRQFGKVTPEGYTKLRQKMLDITKSDWFLILDGDEVWWEDSIKETVRVISQRGNSIDSIVNPYYSLIGDIFHFQPDLWGKYKIDNRKGNINIRAINRNIPGLYTSKPHGQHGYFDGNDTLIQERSKDRRLYIDAYYLHFTHLPRSKARKFDVGVPKRSKKFKKEIGKKFPLDFYYPGVFFEPRPGIVRCPWESMTLGYKVQSAVLTPLRVIKSKIMIGKSGY